MSYLLVFLFLINLSNGYQPVIDLSLSGNEEVFEYADQVLEPSARKGILDVNFEQILQAGQMVQLKLKMKTWMGVTDNEMFLPAEKHLIQGIILDSIRNAGESYVEAFQNIEIQNDKWRHLTHDMIQHRIENPQVLEKFLESDETRFVLFYNDDGQLTNQVAAAAVSLARRQLEQTEILIADCTHHLDICERFGVKDFPSLQCFKNGQFYAEFDDDKIQRIDQDSVMDWVSRLLHSAIYKVKEDDVPYFREGIVSGVKNIQDSVHILFIENKESQIYEDFIKLATKNHGNQIYGVMVDKDVGKWAIHPAIITMKPLEELIKAFTLHTNMSYEEMRDYLEVASDPSLFDLTSPIEALKAFSRDVPVLILYDPLCKSPSLDLQALAGEDANFRKTTARFATINGTTPFSLSLLTSCGVKQFDRPQWILVHPKEHISHILPYKEQNHVLLRDFISNPKQFAEPRESIVSLDIIRNVVIGELYEDTHANFHGKEYHEPGTLPRPPLSDEIHDEL